MSLFGPLPLQLQPLSVDVSTHKDERISAPPHASFCSELIMDRDHNQNIVYIPVILVNAISGLMCFKWSNCNTAQYQQSVVVPKCADTGPRCNLKTRKNSFKLELSDATISVSTVYRFAL